MTQKAAQFLREKLGREAEILSRAPGRVNIIGEHTDYNDGFVMPIATDLATYFAAAPRDDDTVRVYCGTARELVEFSLKTLPRRGDGHLQDYLAGVAWSLGMEGISFRGVDAALITDVPIGSGLSSSAALEVSWALVLMAAAEAEPMEPRKLALACQRAENDFVGMKCGVMDQMASVLGRRDQAILLDCWTLDYQHVPLPADRLAVVVMDTGKPRQLVDSEYNLRRQQCEKAAQLLGVRALRDADMEMLMERAENMDEVIFRRARHVICENERVFECAQALRDADFQTVGRVLNESHASLKEDYEVSCPELDLICELAREQPSCYGARLVGAGFGGCAMALVRSGDEESFGAAVKSAYDARSAYQSRIIPVHADSGAGSFRC
ncbi:MAG: galactokinase [Armatimonadetes bacterium]|nr:galactokinase [Armatimonadota bacterium]